jgi:hypothetical protein
LKVCLQSYSDHLGRNVHFSQDICLELLQSSLLSDVSICDPSVTITSCSQFVFKWCSLCLRSSFANLRILLRKFRSIFKKTKRSQFLSIQTTHNTFISFMTKFCKYIGFSLYALLSADFPLFKTVSIINMTHQFYLFLILFINVINCLPPPEFDNLLHFLYKTTFSRLKKTLENSIDSLSLEMIPNQKKFEITRKKIMARDV